MSMSQYPVISGTFCVLLSRKDSGQRAPETISCKAGARERSLALCAKQCNKNFI